MKKMDNIDETSVLSVELQKEVSRLKTLLNKLETNICILQSGNIWNGNNAYESSQALIGHLDHDKTLLSKLEKCSDVLESVSK